MKIYTKKGDTGRTSLFGGTELSKSDIRIDAYGTVDELNSFLGHLKCELQDNHQFEIVNTVQKDLFNLGSHLASDGTLNDMLPQFEESHILYLEQAIDSATKILPKLKSFILPEGSESATRAHIARTICRRAERRITMLHEVDTVDPLIIKYLNRLSDYLFTLARELNHQHGILENPWNSD